MLPRADRQFHDYFVDFFGFPIVSYRFFIEFLFKPQRSLQSRARIKRPDEENRSFFNVRNFDSSNIHFVHYSQAPMSADERTVVKKQTQFAKKTHKKMINSILDSSNCSSSSSRSASSNSSRSSCDSSSRSISSSTSFEASAIHAVHEMVGEFSCSNNNNNNNNNATRSHAPKAAQRLLGSGWQDRPGSHEPGEAQRLLGARLTQRKQQDNTAKNADNTKTHCRCTLT